MESITLHDTLQEAVQDCVYVVALTGRERAAKRTIIRPGPAATELIARSERGTVAVVAGRRTRASPTRSWITATPSSAFPPTLIISSLNLAQAVAIMCYEIRLATGGERQPFKPPRKLVGARSPDCSERLFADWERALWGIDFFQDPPGRTRDAIVPRNHPSGGPSTGGRPR